jgi:hypothetical protein
LSTPPKRELCWILFSLLTRMDANEPIPATATGQAAATKRARTGSLSRPVPFSYVVSFFPPFNRGTMVAARPGRQRTIEQTGPQGSVSRECRRGAATWRGSAPTLSRTTAGACGVLGDSPAVRHALWAGSFRGQSVRSVARVRRPSLASSMPTGRRRVRLAAPARWLLLAVLIHDVQNSPHPVVNLHHVEHESEREPHKEPTRYSPESGEKRFVAFTFGHEFPCLDVVVKRRRREDMLNRPASSRDCGKTIVARFLALRGSPGLPACSLGFPLVSAPTRRRSFWIPSRPGLLAVNRRRPGSTPSPPARFVTVKRFYGRAWNVAVQAAAS